jgi:DNA-binding LacI/PurR family transcriptional regulator
MLRENRDILLSAPVDLFCYNYASHPFGRLNCHIVSIDNGRDGMVAANYLIKKGYTKFSFVLGSNNQNWSKLRFEEFAFFARARKFTVRKISATTGWLDKCLKIVKKKEPHHAFVCVTDEYAENMKKAFLLHGLALGKDFKTFSFNDDVNAEKNGLTTMRPPVKKIGQLLARFISKEMVEHNEEIRLTYKLSSDIIERSSC